MIGKTEWFNRRKYTGWGLTPKTWQGWVYIGVFVGIIVGLTKLPVDELIKNLGIGITVGILLIDSLHIMASITLDEMETKFEAIAERNASWSMIITAIIVIFIKTANIDSVPVNDLISMLILVLIAGTVVKSLTFYYLIKKGI